MKKNGLLAISLLMLLASFTPAKKTITVSFYNTENLFDTVDDPQKDDNEFLPGSEKKWTSERYQKKLEDLSAVLAAMDSVQLPALIGLCEIENRKVLEDLIHTGKLSGKKYSIAHEESPDMRGIDVALLYQPEFFREITHEAIPISFPNEPQHKTRDILHVTGKIGAQTVHVFVNHWPSRIGGEESEASRVFVASVLKKNVEKVLQTDAKANIIIMGDMNDEPANKSIFETLGAKLPSSKAPLVNLMLPLDQQNKGTYFYRGDWNMLDNLIVSQALVDGKKLDVEGKGGHIFSRDWMVFKSKKGEISPNRTYGGNNYYGGISDHFPVYFKLKLN